NSGVGYRSTMRICGVFSELRGAIERPKSDGLAREGVDTPFFAVNHADCVGDLETGLTKRLNRLERGAAGRDDVLDEANPLPRLEDAFEPLRRPIGLCFLADDQEGE